MSLIDFNEFMLNRYSRSGHDERLVQLLATQWHLFRVALNSSSERRLNDELEFATRQATALYGRPLDPLMTRLVVLSSGGRFIELGESGRPLLGADRVALLSQLNDDFVAYLAEQDPPLGKLDQDLSELTFDLLGLYQVLTLDQDAATREALDDLYAEALDRFTAQAPWLCDIIITLSQAQAMPALVKRYIATTPTPVGSYIQADVWATLSVPELCALGHDSQGVNQIATLHRDSTFSHQEYEALLKTAIGDSEHPTPTMLWLWADKLPVDLLCEFISKAEVAKISALPLDRILKTLRQRDDVTDAQCIEVLMSSNMGFDQVRTYQENLDMPNEVLVELILSADEPINALAAHMLLLPNVQAGSSTDLQIKNTPLDNLLKASNLDLFAKRTPSGKLLGDRVKDAIDQLPLTFNVQKGVTLLHGNVGKRGKEVNFANGEKIQEQLLNRYSKQVERLMKRQNNKQLASPPVPDMPVADVL